MLSIPTTVFTPNARASSARLRHAFGTPRQVLQTTTLTEVRPMLDAVEAASRQGAWCLVRGRCALCATRRHPLVSLDDLPQVTAIAFLNSLRGWVDADWKN